MRTILFKIEAKSQSLSTQATVETFFFVWEICTFTYSLWKYISFYFLLKNTVSSKIGSMCTSLRKLKIVFFVKNILSINCHYIPSIKGIALVTLKIVHFYHFFLKYFTLCISMKGDFWALIYIANYHYFFM